MLEFAKKKPKILIPDNRNIPLRHFLAKKERLSTVKNVQDYKIGKQWRIWLSIKDLSMVHWNR